VNTLRGLAVDPRTLQPVLARATGGLSGPALKPVALAAVHACYAATQLPIVGMGGVTCGQDVVELVACGASQVALGTVLFGDPGAPSRIREELSAVDTDAVFGAAHRVEKSLELRAKVVA
jgi:dihydroorotate dehydrogenase (NAD+) catalytic subunit